jgi:GAF domain-containing protein
VRDPTVQTTQAAPELEYLRLLLRVSSALAEALTPGEVLDAVIRYGVPAAEAEAGLIALLADEDPEIVEIAAAVGYPPGQLEPWRRVPVTAELPFTVAVRTGEPLFFSTTDELRARFPQTPAGDRSHARAFLPLLVEGQAIGALALMYRDEVTFDEERRARKLTIARQVAQALERARHYAAELALRERMQFLAEASELLGSSLDYQLTFTRLADLAVSRLGGLVRDRHRRR